jgi:hypothetical protein
MEQPMQPFSPEELLAVWEMGWPQHPLDRALTILAAVTPGMTRDALADLSIGERDTRLLQLRTVSFGSHAEGFAECPECAERVEFPFDTANFVQPNALTASAQEIEIHGMRFRLPTSRDLAEVVKAPDSATALRLLVERCIRSRTPLSGGENEQPDHHLPDQTVETISRAILDADPRAEIRLELNCPSCAHAWKLLFDIGEFFWLEISAQAHRLLREIDALARAYGWTEREILSLPARRRQTYLELIAA